MPAVVRVGDPNQVGGLVIKGAFSVLVNGRPICTHVSPVTPHPCCGGLGCGRHCAAVTTWGSTSVTAEGKPVVYVGVFDSCGHSRALGSFDTSVGM